MARPRQRPPPGLSAHPARRPSHRAPPSTRARALTTLVALPSPALPPSPGVTPLRAGYNPATWMLEVTGGSMSTTVAAVELDWPQHFRASGRAALVEQRAGELVAANAQSTAAVQLASDFAQPFGVQVGALARGGG